MRRIWQGAMIGLARSDRVKRAMQSRRAASQLAKRYVAGGSADDAAARAARLLELHGLRSSIFYLGEYVETRSGVDINRESIHQAIAQFSGMELDCHISVDPTQIGLQLSSELMLRNGRDLAAAVAEAPGSPGRINCLMFDMEDASVTDATIAAHDRLAAEGLPVALTLQAYLRRTEQDLQRQIRAGSRVRLVRGAFAAPEAIAYTRSEEVQRNWRRLIDAMFSETAKAAGFYPVVATHDSEIQAYAIARARASGWRQGEYEFEMLLGVRGALAVERAGQGERVRLYVPFGEDWWPHAVRRIGESPKNALLLARSLISG